MSVVEKNKHFPKSLLLSISKRIYQLTTFQVLCPIYSATNSNGGIVASTKSKRTFNSESLTIGLIVKIAQNFALIETCFSCHEKF